MVTDLQRQGLVTSDRMPAGKLREIAHANILSLVTDAAHEYGLVGEPASIKLVYLTLTSRLLDKPINAVVKAPSASGKSFLVNTLLKLLPDSAYYSISSASPKVLFRPEIQLVHKALVVQEAVWSRELDYVLRTLISEGRLEYQTLVGGEAVTLKNPGPIAFLTTTTRWNLDAELETRLYTIYLSQKPQQTRAILLGIADKQQVKIRETEQGRLLTAYQEWLETAKAKVIVPYASNLAKLVDPDNVRVRRDFGQLLALVHSHALLHCQARKRTSEGYILAHLADYQAVYNLITGMAHESPSPVMGWQRQMIDAVKAKGESNILGLSESLGWALATTWRRARSMIKAGYLGNLTDHAGEEARLYVRAELGTEWLPQPDRLARK